MQFLAPYISGRGSDAAEPDPWSTGLESPRTAPLLSSALVALPYPIPKESLRTVGLAAATGERGEQPSRDPWVKAS